MMALVITWKAAGVQEEQKISHHLEVDQIVTE
jgi:hypothetical protein